MKNYTTVYSKVKRFTQGLLLASFLFISGYGNAHNVYEIISNSKDHTILTIALQLSGLDGALQGKGPFTVLAPTDAAFNALPAGVLNALVEDPKGELSRVLLFHVLGYRAPESGLYDGDPMPTLLGQDLMLKINNDGIFFNNAKVIAADLEANNGLVHVIDAVLVPAAEETTPATVVDIIVGSEAHKTLATAVTLAGLVDALSGEGPFTVFAPTDAAFAALPEGLLDALVADPKGALTDILLYHVVAARALSTDLSDGQIITTLLDKDVTVKINKSGVFINDAQVIIADLKSGNGVVHVIDAVLVPESEQPTSTINPDMTAPSVYPNPATEILNISTGSTIEEIRLFDMIGKVVYQQVINQPSFQLPVNQFNRGMYLLQVRSTEGISTERIVIGR